MNFCSDNVTGCAPEILSALLDSNTGAAMPYGEDEITKRFNTRLAEVFETEVIAFPVATGSAANALALSTMTPPYGAIYCHAQSHINVDECGAPEFYTGGAKLVTLAGEQGKLTATDLTNALTHAGIGSVHRVQPATVSVTQATEAGTVYSPAEVIQVGEVCRRYGLKLHMDGARFANAVASLHCTPAEITWKAGVDVLCFGATKNGALAAEAVIFFDRSLAETFAYRRKRGGHLFSKMRFLSVQLQTYLQDDLWLQLARHANERATQLAIGLETLPGVRLCYPVQANEVFVEMPVGLVEHLLAAGVQFYRWEHSGRGTIVRLVTAFNTQATDVAALITTAQAYSAFSQKGLR